MRRFFKTLLATLGAMPGAVFADSCWDHNGSVMRLADDGPNRWFYYESPRQALWASGVQSGTLLFNGTKNGDWYAGTARVFSSSCMGNPLEYWVEGPVWQNPLRVVLEGTREVYSGCQPTGRMTTDQLVFTYLYNC